MAASLDCSAQASSCGGFSCCEARALGVRASVTAARRLSSCGARAWLLHHMCDLPGLGMEPLSPALAGRFFTTEPPRKPGLSGFYTSTLNGYLGVERRKCPVSEFLCRVDLMQALPYR